MLAELGHLALILALCLSLFTVLLGVLGARRLPMLLIHLARPLALSHAFCTALAFAVLVAVFLQNDFSVALVAGHSHTQLPWYYRITATWGNHEGSMLLWALVLALWMAAVAWRTRRSLDDAFAARVLVVMSVIALGFELFILLTSNPFWRQLPEPPLQGNDLNPLLQDLAMIVHPPTLYAGYVGLAVAFAFAVAALWEGRVDAAWARRVKPWTLVAWMFLTAGIALGSWWAYYELGWGGWWFWDPVENASLMPWLVATALIHSLAVTEKRNAFYGWTLLLAILAFALSLLGTFLVRSGVLTSVHSFASDPERGLFILIFLVLVIGGSLLLYALRAGGLVRSVGFAPVSRETLLLLNNLLLLVAAATVLLGTLFPLLMDALNQGRYSVGPPYFNLAVGPVLLLIVFLLALAPVLHWQRSRLAAVWPNLRFPLLTLVLVAAVLPWLLPEGSRSLATAGSLLVVWVWAVAVQQVLQRVRLQGWRSVSLTWLGMLVAHAGVALLLLGVVVSGIYSESRDVRLRFGDSLELGAYRFQLQTVERTAGPNYRADTGLMQVWQGERLLTELKPQKRLYVSGGQPMTEAAIRPGVLRDIYVALGEPLTADAWSLRVDIKPGVRWIWSGAGVMVLGGLLALLGRRRSSIR